MQMVPGCTLPGLAPVGLLWEHLAGHCDTPYLPEARRVHGIQVDLREGTLCRDRASRPTGDPDPAMVINH